MEENEILSEELKQMILEAIDARVNEILQSQEISQDDTLTAREKDLTAREVRAKALEELAARGLPAALAEALPTDDEAHCMDALDRIESAFREAVSIAVDERLKGRIPEGGGSANVDADSLTDEEYYHMKNI